MIFPQKGSDDDAEVITIIGRKENADAAKAHLLGLIKDLVSNTFSWFMCGYCIYAFCHVQLAVIFTAPPSTGQGGGGGGACGLQVSSSLHPAQGTGE